MIEPDLPADTEIYMTLTGATGTPTGRARRSSTSHGTIKVGTTEG